MSLDPQLSYKWPEIYRLPRLWLTQQGRKRSLLVDSARNRRFREFSDRFSFQPNCLKRNFPSSCISLRDGAVSKKKFNTHLYFEDGEEKNYLHKVKFVFVFLNVFFTLNQYAVQRKKYSIGFSMKDLNRYELALF